MDVGPLNVSGLLSGIDWRTMVDQLINIERRRVNLVSQQKTNFDSKLKEWRKINTQLKALSSAAIDLRATKSFQLFKSTLASSSATTPEEVLSVTTDATAAKGNYSVKVLATAQAQKLGSASFESDDEALGLSGDFLINGKAITVSASDTLENIRDRLNDLNSGSSVTGVTAAIVRSSSGGYQLNLTSDITGADGFSLQDASSTDILESLGFADGTVAVKTLTSDGAKSDGLSSSTSVVGSLLGLGTVPGATDVTIGGQTVSINLQTQSLTAIANAIDGLNGVSAEVVSETDEDGATLYRIDVSGTTSFSDSGNVLQALGFLKGNRTAVNEVHAGDVANSRIAGAGGGAITDATTFAQINTGGGANNVLVGDTISISGYDNDGTAVSTTFTISDVNQALNATGGLLESIETAFGGPTAVNAYLSDGSDGNTAGTLIVKDLVAGDSQLSISLTANNQGGGTLNLGDLTETTSGRNALLVGGSDSKVQVDGVTYQRSTNKIEDVIAGVTLDLKSANPSTTITLNIGNDLDAIKDKVKAFVSAYNTVVGAIKTNFTYDPEKKTSGGPLFGDVTLQTVKSTLSNLVGQQILSAGNYTGLSFVGINLDNKGSLSIDDAKLTTALQTNLNSVTSLFAVTGSGTAAGLQYISHGRSANAGTYEVNLTAAASRAAVTGSANLDDGNGLDADETFTITDTATGRIANIALTAGMNANDVVSAINSELAAQYSQIITGSQNNTKTSGAGGGAITASTTFGQINTGGDANNVTNNDTISFSGTTRTGKSISGSFTIADKDTSTIQDFLNSIETAYGTGVKASIDSNGAVLLTDLTPGSSQLTFGITPNNQGSGSLSFGAQSITTAGRYALEITASKEAGGFLKLAHNSYGASQGFTISQTANNLGLADATLNGTDIAGTINGQSATGSGQTLIGDEGAVNVEGLAIQYTGAATGDIGDVTVDFGVMELVERAMYNITDQFNGTFRYTEESLKNNMARNDATIERMERRLTLQRERLVRQFIAMESAIGRIKAQSVSFGA